MIEVWMEKFLVSEWLQHNKSMIYSQNNSQGTTDNGHSICLLFYEAKGDKSGPQLFTFELTLSYLF